MKDRIKKQIEELTLDFWHFASLNRTYAVGNVYEEIEDLKAELSMIEGIERAAFIKGLLAGLANAGNSKTLQESYEYRLKEYDAGNK